MHSVKLCKLVACKRCLNEKQRGWWTQRSFESSLIGDSLPVHTRPSSAWCPYSSGGAHWFLGYGAVLVARYSLKSTGSEGSGYSQGNQGELYRTRHACAGGLPAHLHLDPNVITQECRPIGFTGHILAFVWVRVLLMGCPFVSCRRGVCICMLFTVRTSPNLNTSSLSILRPSSRWVLPHRAALFESRWSIFRLRWPVLWKLAHSSDSPESFGQWRPWTFEGSPNNNFILSLAKICVSGYIFRHLEKNVKPHSAYVYWMVLWKTKQAF